jgi:hypothetical protein
MIQTPLIRYSLAIICIWFLNLHNTFASNFRLRQTCPTNFSADTITAAFANPLLDLDEGNRFRCLSTQTIALGIPIGLCCLQRKMAN